MPCKRSYRASRSRAARLLHSFFPRHPLPPLVPTHQETASRVPQDTALLPTDQLPWSLGRCISKIDREEWADTAGADQSPCYIGPKKPQSPRKSQNIVNAGSSEASKKSMHNGILTSLTEFACDLKRIVHSRIIAKVMTAPCTATSTIDAAKGDSHSIPIVFVTYFASLSVTSFAIHKRNAAMYNHQHFAILNNGKKIAIHNAPTPRTTLLA